MTIALLGGTFDPIHQTHIAIATTLQKIMGFSEFRFVPCQNPVHKPNAYASAEHRLAMLKLALADYPQLTIDERELQRDTPSYMSETLRSIRTEISNNTPLCLLLGDDAMQQFDSWHEWKAILELTHLIVINRPSEPNGQACSETLRKFIETHRTHHQETLLHSPSGKIYYQQLPASTVAATKIREALASGGMVSNDELPPAVLQYIKEHALYRH